MMFLKQAIPSGCPWIDYKEATKTGFEQVFVFRIEQFLYFVLREICIVYPCSVNGRSHLPMKVSVQIISTQNQFSPVPVDPQLFSSPSQNYTLGALDEDSQGHRKQPIVFNVPCDKGDNIVVSVQGIDAGFTVGCMLTGRKYEAEKWL